MEILTSRQMQEIDRRAVGSYGIPEIVLMENAGLQVLNFLQRTYDDLALRGILLLCGRGNNGGDALVVARHLRNRGIPFDSVLFGRRSQLRGSAAVNLRMLSRVGIKPLEVTTGRDWARVRRRLGEYDLVIDAILGTGLTRPVRGLLVRAFRDVNDASLEVVAVDVPSGLTGNSGVVPGPCIAADHTVTFVRPKMPHIFPPADALCGDVHVADISIPSAAIDAQRIDLSLIEEPELLPRLPVRRAESHKGNYGHALVVAGSRGKAGAARMVAMGALRTGCGLVTAAVPGTIQPGLVRGAMEGMSEALPETGQGTLAASGLGELLELLKRKDALAVGPGLTSHPETAKLVRELVRKARLPLVLDADGINAFAGRPELLRYRAGRPLILTPHPGEMARLLGISTGKVQAARIDIARQFARRQRCHLVLKGYRTLIATPDGRVRVNPTGNPGMATAGSGDVLTGFLAGLVAQGIDIEGAVLLAVYLHGLAGDIAASEIGEMPLLARDILARYPRALARIRPPRSSQPAGGRKEN